MNAPLLLECAPRLFGSLAALAWVASGTARRGRLSGGPRAWDLALCDTTVRTLAWITLTALLLGTFGLLTAPTWFVAAVGLGALLRVLPIAGAPPAPRTDDGSAPSAVFVVVLSGFLIGRAVFGLRNPPADWDSLQYHLPMVAHWIHSHALGVAGREPQAFGTYYPGGGELLQLWAAFSTGRETLMTWPGILALGVLALALRRLAQSIGARAGVAEALALALITAPGVGGLTLGTRIDNILAAEIGVALLFAVRHLRDGGRGDLATALIALGLAAGTKANGPVLAAVAVVLFALAGRRRGHGPGVFAPELLALPLVIGSYWFTRDFLLTGNPLYPSEWHFGPLRFAGIEAFEVLSRTTQLAVWREGYAGHLTAANLQRFFGPGLLLVVLGIVRAAALVAWRRAAPGAADARPGRTLAPGVLPLAGFALAGALLFLVSPFSGAYWPAEHGRPPGLNWDNLRYLLPAMVAALPLAAVGLSGRVSPIAIALLGGAIAFDVRRWLGHVVPGVALAAAVWAAVWAVKRARRGAERRPESHARAGLWRGAAGVVVASAALAFAVTAVDGQREQLTDRIWDGYLPRIHNLRAADLRVLRAEAHGHAIAVVGMDAWWGFYGRDFSGNPAYVPVGAAANATGHWSFSRDDRSRADSTAWRRNLAARDARFVVTGAFGGDCDSLPIERRWLAADTSAFERLARNGCDEAWRARKVPATR